MLEVAPQADDPRSEQQGDADTRGQHGQAEPPDGGQHAARGEQQAQTHHEQEAPADGPQEEAAGAALLVGARPDQPEPDRGERHRPHHPGRQDEPGLPEEQQHADGEQDQADRALGGGHPRVRVDGSAGLRIRDQRPAGEVQRHAEAVGEGQHDQGQAHDHRVDGEVLPEAAGDTGQHPIVLGARQARREAERVLVEAEGAGHGLSMIPRGPGHGHRDRH